MPRYNVMTSYQTAALQVDDGRALDEVLTDLEASEEHFLIGNAIVPVRTVSYIQQVGS